MVVFQFGILAVVIAAAVVILKREREQVLARRHQREEAARRATSSTITFTAGRGGMPGDEPLASRGGTGSAITFKTEKDLPKRPSP